MMKVKEFFRDEQGLDEKLLFQHIWDSWYDDYRSLSD